MLSGYDTRTLRPTDVFKSLLTPTTSLHYEQLASVGRVAVDTRLFHTDLCFGMTEREGIKTATHRHQL